MVSDCGTYRYVLTRQWDPKLPVVAWCMLNPSTADAAIDDPTVRKCVGFATRWGFGGIRIVNLFAFRATDPRGLRDALDPVGPDNARHLRTALQGAVVVAWGGSVPKTMGARIAIDEVRDMARRESWSCLGTTKAGEPRHPLMLAYATERQPWPVAG